MYATSTSSAASRPDLTLATALVVGVGALGCAAATALARAGVGHLTLIDDDNVESSNLQRQILFDERAIGHSKAAVAAAALATSGSTCKIVARIERVDEGNVDRHLAGQDVVIDATDEPRTKDLLNRAAIAGAFRWCTAVSHAPAAWR